MSFDMPDPRMMIATRPETGREPYVNKLSV